MSRSPGPSTRLHWVVRNRLARPTVPLGIDDLPRKAAPLGLAGEG